MSANILRGCAAAQCHRTFAHEYGAAVGGPFPGTNGSPGDVRRCEHGKVWRWIRCERYRIDVWQRVSPFWEPLTYRRALRALAAPDRGSEASE